MVRHLRVGARRGGGFSLIELLVVISLIAVMMSLLLPSLGRARSTQGLMACQTQMRSQMRALAIYQNDYAGFGPHRSPVSLANTEFNPQPAQPEAEWDSTDPVSGMDIWALRSGNTAVTVGMGQVVAADYLQLKNMFCPGMIASEDNCIGEGFSGLVVGKSMPLFRRWEWRQWVFDESVAHGYSADFYTTHASQGAGYGGYFSLAASPGSDTANSLIRASYGYRSGDYSYVRNYGGAGRPLDTAGSVATGNGINALYVAEGASPMNSAGFGVRGQAYAGPELAKPDNAVNDSSRAILCENFPDQHMTYRSIIISAPVLGSFVYSNDMNVAYADGSAGFRTDINQTLTGISTPFEYMAFSCATFTWSGGGVLNTAKGFYLEEDLGRRNHRRGGDRTWLSTGFAGNFGVGGFGNIPMRSSMFAALDACAKISR